MVIYHTSCTCARGAQGSAGAGGAAAGAQGSREGLVTVDHASGDVSWNVFKFLAMTVVVFIPHK